MEESVFFPYPKAITRRSANEPGRPIQTFEKGRICWGFERLFDRTRKNSCYHVWKRFEVDRNSNPAAVLALALGDEDCPITFKRAESQIVDANEELDLIVFDFAPEGIQVNREPVKHEKRWFRIRNWPIQGAVKGETLVIMGFPGKLVTKVGMNCTFRYYPIPLVVSDVTPRNIGIFDSDANQEVLNDINRQIGGLSGSPAYVLAKDGARRVGFVKSGRELAEGDDDGKTSVFAGGFFLTPAHILNQDGTLRRDGL